MFLSNGSLALLYDENFYIRDVYYPFFGQHYHHSFGGVFKIGLWHDGRFTWLEAVEREVEQAGGRAVLRARWEGLDVYMEDVVLISKPALVRRVSIRGAWLRQGYFLPRL